MTDLDSMATFVAVAQLGSFSAAAKAQRLPRSTVSQRISRLESSLAVRLLERTTRAVRLTGAGVAYHERCARILAEVEAANAEVRELQSAPHGLLRIATPLLFGQTFLAGLAAEFSKLHPSVEIEIIASDRPIRPIEEGFDIAIMLFGATDDSSLISRRLKGGDLWLCASPEYLVANRAPTSPAQLTQHACLVYGEARQTRWTLERHGKKHRIDIAGRISMNSFVMLHEAARMGAGIAPVPRVLAGPDVRAGKLLRVLSDWEIDRKDLRVVCPSARFLSPRVRSFVDMLVERFRRLGEASRDP